MGGVVVRDRVVRSSGYRLGSLGVATPIMPTMRHYSTSMSFET